MAGASREGNSAGSAEAATPPSLAQYLSLDPHASGEPKHSRHGELRRALQSDDQSEELRRVRASVSESSGKAREKVQSLQDAIQKLDRYKNIVTRKRLRSNSVADKLGAAPSSGALRIGAHNNNSPGAMSKRMRSSPLDGRLEGRGSVPTRQGPLANSDKSSPLEKERNCARTSVTVSGLSEDKLQGLSTGGEGWEKKLKRRRSVGTMLNRGNDADRDVKPVGQHRPANEARLRSSDGLAYRHGASAGAVAGNKTDSSSKHNSIGSRILSKIKVDYATLPNERKVRHAGIEKEQAMIKGSKVHTFEDMQTGSLSPLPKTKACRSPRTSSLVMGPSSTFQRSTGGNNEREETPYSNKASPLRGMTNRKRSTHSNASSPPVAWVGQRPQKMSRMRRANVVSPVSNFDEVLSEGSPLDTAARSSPIESCGVLLTENVTSSNTQKVTKVDNISSPVGLSGSGGLAATECKVKEKVTNSGDVENQVANSVHNATGLIFSSDKNRTPLKEELEDGGVPRQERSGRGTMHVNGCSSISKEKLNATETRKPLKCGRPGPEKNERKLGRPLMKKCSDRKDSFCYSQALNCESTDKAGEPEDDREELLAAANAARNALVSAYSGPFWKEMEPMLTFIRSENLAFLKHQINLVEELEMGMSCMPDGGHNVIASTDYSRPQTMEELSSQGVAPSTSSVLPEGNETNGLGAKGHIDHFFPSEENHSTGPQKVEADEWFHEMAPMTQRLLSALIVEDDFSDSNVVQRDILVDFSNTHTPYIANRYLENELEASAVTSNFGQSVDFTHSNNTSVVHQSLCNGYTASSNFISSNSQMSIHCENLSDGVNVAVCAEYNPLHCLIPQISWQCQNPGKEFPSPPYEYHYGQMSVNDKILIELQSIGICLETVPKRDDEEDKDINKMISELRRRLHDQVKQKKCGLHKLDKAIQDTKNIEERSLEQHALNKLVERAYRKLQVKRVGSRHKAGVRKSANKDAKDRAFVLAFARRTLARCQKYEGTKKSCFSEPSLWSVLSAPLPSSDAKSTEGVERLRHQRLGRSPLEGVTNRKKNNGARDRNRNASAKGSGLKSGRHSSGSGTRGERKNKTNPKQKLVQLSTSGNVLGGVVESSPTPATQKHPEPAGPPCAKITRQPRNTPRNAAQRSIDPALTNLPGLDDMIDVPGGVDVQGNDFSSWFPDGLDDSLPQDCDFSGALEVPDDDLTQLGFM